SEMLVELFIGEDLIEEESSGAGGEVSFDIDIDDYEVENVFTEFPQGLHTFRLKVTDACPRSSEVRFVGRIGSALDPNDNDGDGYSTNDGDCDDTDPNNFPGNLETIDGADNDCDDRVDDETAVWDNDCDGYCESPPCLGQGPAAHGADLCEGLADDAATEADCDDRRDDYDQDDRSDGALRSPGLEELADHQDQDCDGAIDEGTNYADDDGDGRTELAGDCDDADSSTFPSAVEWCDETDNDCNGAIDDDCLEILLAPRVVGDVLTDRFEVPLGDEVQATALVLSDDPDLTWAWSTDTGTIVSATDGTELTWQAPENTNENQELLGSFASLVVTVTDSQGRSDTAFGVIRIGEFSDGPSYSGVGGQVCGGCSTLGSRPGGLPFSLLLLLALAGEFLRRRP
ncbi:MAG: putative metal-binding motif-containing protein, partial [Myxococcota bacterium]|nr:putative metal-binding motif-containing protein [Myxococcota bacterium]